MGKKSGGTGPVLERSALVMITHLAALSALCGAAGDNEMPVSPPHPSVLIWPLHGWVCLQPQVLYMY